MPSFNNYTPFLCAFQFKEIIFIDVVTGQKAYFTRVLDDPTTASANLNQKATTLGLWRPHGAANTAYDYQLLICNTAFYSGFHVSAYTQSCYKRCDNWCADYSSPYFRTAAVTSPSYAGVAFNENGARSLSPRLMSVGLRWTSKLTHFVVNPFKSRNKKTLESHTLTWHETLTKLTKLSSTAPKTFI